MQELLTDMESGGSWKRVMQVPFRPQGINSSSRCNRYNARDCGEAQAEDQMEGIEPQQGFLIVRGSSGALGSGALGSGALGSGALERRGSSSLPITRTLDIGEGGVIEVLKYSCLHIYSQLVPDWGSLSNYNQVK